MIENVHVKIQGAVVSNVRVFGGLWHCEATIVERGKKRIFIIFFKIVKYETKGNGGGVCRVGVCSQGIVVVLICAAVSTILILFLFKKGNTTDGFDV